MLTEWTDIIELCDRVIFLTLDQDTCRRRRKKRSYDPPDIPGYFEEVLWPAYQQHLQKALAFAREDRRISFLDVTSDSDHPNAEYMLSLIQSFSDDVIRICYEPLNVDEALRLINSPSCGATSVFVGTTRDTFGGRKVVRLDYESYDEMAYKELRRLCRLIREKYPSVERVVILHRIGEVAVGETSVVIATASPHRKDAIHATAMAIDELKRTVPIWKKEVYEDGGCSWKENGEWCAGDRCGESTEEKSFAQANRHKAFPR
ncbi:molybdopterin converting factor, subunit 2 [Oesophagostomum dentatum]|uniref:Molybdopterin synthase catalytic subunit n=1 Tax=Oesophagostomum dentatum TaxID=61180 RepID=A0A0B1RNX7_OESDE|nr:molybdopterin converting factor, subunit 2 [Oesophagostomum dentatum]